MGGSRRRTGCPVGPGCCSDTAHMQTGLLDGPDDRLGCIPRAQYRWKSRSTVIPVGDDPPGLEQGLARPDFRPDLLDPQ